jgi:hypothetical protein
MKQITKSYLEYLGVTDVTADGKVFTKRGELKPGRTGRSKNNPHKQEKLAIRLYDSEKYKSTPKKKRTSSSGVVSIRLHQLVYAWFHGEIPYGKEIHHIDINYLNNSIDNLEALTPAEHKAKHAAVRASTRELKCKLNIPREWYVKQLEELEAIENKTKTNYDKISNYRAKLRYYDSHVKEVTKLTEFQKDKAELAYFKKCFKDEGNKKMWHECCKVEKVAKASSIEDAQMIIRHALEVIHRHFGRN